MMKQDWKQLYGPVPESFEYAVQIAVAKAPACRRPSLPKLAVVLTVVLALMLGTAYAVTSYAGLLDSLRGAEWLTLRDGVDAMPTATPSVTIKGSNPYVEATILETLCDGYQTWAQVKFSPKGNVVLMPRTARPSEDMNARSEKKTGLAGVTYAEKARAADAKLVMLSAASGFVPEVHLDDGSIIMVCTDASLLWDDYNVLEFTTWVVPEEMYDGASWEPPYEDGFKDGVELYFHAPVSEQRAVYDSGELAVEIEPMHLTIRRVTLTETPLACYLRWAYDADEAAIVPAIDPESGTWIGDPGLLYRRCEMYPILRYDGKEVDVWRNMNGGESILEGNTNVYYSEFDEIPLDFEMQLGANIYQDGWEYEEYGSFTVHLEKIE